MTAVHIVARNRANAQQSTGPQTTAGKAIVSQNAVKHGGLALVPVIAGIEDAAAWETHRAGIVASLGAEGTLETVLAERIALAFWRLARLARAEQATILQAQRQTGQRDTQGLTESDRAEERVQRARCVLRELLRLADLADTEPLEDVEAEAVLSAVATAAGIEDYDELSFPFVPQGEYASEHVGWTAKQLRQALGVVAKAMKAPLDDLRTAALRSGRHELAAAKRHVGEVAERQELVRLTHLVPERFMLERLLRYETHLSRQWVQALHELERLQAARTGQPVLPPLAVDVTLNGAE